MPGKPGVPGPGIPPFAPVGVEGPGGVPYKPTPGPPGPLSKPGPPPGPPPWKCPFQLGGTGSSRLIAGASPLFQECLKALKRSDTGNLSSDSILVKLNSLATLSSKMGPPLGLFVFYPTNRLPS